MATLVRDVERPPFLDPPSKEQLAFGGVAAPSPERTPREAQSARESLSDRLRTERAVEAALEGNLTGTTSVRIATTRGGGATLDELLVGAWEGLSARRLVACPVCAGSMRPRGGASGGACEGCGSRLR